MIWRLSLWYAVILGVVESAGKRAGFAVSHGNTNGDANGNDLQRSHVMTSTIEVAADTTTCRSSAFQFRNFSVTPENSTSAETSRSCIGAAVLLCVLLLLAATSVAQVTTTTIYGTVTDATGASLAGAQVTVTSTETNLSRTAPTNTQGEYRIEFLPVGTYEVEVKAEGFRKYVQKGIVMQVNQSARVDAKLEIGGATETVTVTEVVPLVDTSTAALGRTVDNAEITSLPIVNRNVYTLLDLTPGVQSNNTTNGGAAIVLGYPEQRTTINGGVDGGAGSVNYFLDGGTNMTGLRNTGNILPSPDAIQEFRVQTNSYNAEYGRYASGVINVLTKSGTNQFHGSLFEFVRNNIFNANDWGSTLETPPLHRNQFGGTIGGPIKRDRTFFFFSYSGLRQTTSTFLNNAVVPTARERAGDFSQSSVLPVDPVTKKTYVCNGVTGVICPNQLDPVAVKIINTYIPTANIQPGNFWQGFIPSPFNTDEFLGKVDHSFNEKHRLTGSYFETAGTNTIRAGSGNLPWSIQQFTWRQHNANLSETWIINPNMVNQAWLSYTRNFGGRLNLPQTSLGDLGSAFTIQGTPSLPQITVTGFFTLTNAIGGPLAGTNFYSVRDVFSYTHGRHAFKFGGEVSLDKDIQQTLLNNYGVFSFSGAKTKNALADFMVGSPNSLSQDAPVTGYTNSWYTALFAQDDFRIHPRLTLNLGLRWDVQTPPTDPLDREATYVAGAQSKVRPTAPLGALFVGDPGVERGIVPVRWTHFSPRVGLAWDPFGDGKTSIRAGAGVFYGSLSGNEWNTTTNFEPFAIRLTFTNSATATLSDPYKGLVGGNPFPYNGKFIAGGSIYGPSLDFRWPYTYQLNFSVQRQLTRDLSMTAAYVGSLSHNLPFTQDVNYPVLTPTATASNVQARRANQGFGAILLLQSNQTANYHGLQISGVKRMGHHVSFNTFYTFSKTLTSVQLNNNTTQGGAQNFSKLFEDKGRSDTNQTHIFVASVIYQPDYYGGDNRVFRALANGWSVSPIVKLRSGLPFTVLNGTDANLDGNSTDRANIVGNPHLDDPTAALWFNTAAFVRNPQVTGVVTDGNSARNLLDGPGYRSVDLAISRTFNLHERVKLQFRAEGTNAFNNVNLGTPGNTAATSTFGVIRSAGAMRQLQFGLRLTY
jgi:hypothetical protein